MSTKRQIPIAVLGPGANASTIAALLHQNARSLLLCGRTPRPQLKVRPDNGEPLIAPGPVHTDHKGKRPVYAKDCVSSAVRRYSVAQQPATGNQRKRRPRTQLQDLQGS